MPCLCKQCRSRSVVFWRSQLIWICTVCHSVCEFISTIWIKESDWLTVRSGHGILIYSAWQGLIQENNCHKMDPEWFHPIKLIWQKLIICMFKHLACWGQILQKTKGWLFFNFHQKIRHDISFQLSTLKTIWMKCLVLFLKNIKKKKMEKILLELRSKSCSLREKQENDF